MILVTSFMMRAVSITRSMLEVSPAPPISPFTMWRAMEHASLSGRSASSTRALTIATPVRPILSSFG